MEIITNDQLKKIRKNTEKENELKPPRENTLEYIVYKIRNSILETARTDYNVVYELDMNIDEEEYIFMYKYKNKEYLNNPEYISDSHNIHLLRQEEKCINNDIDKIITRLYEIFPESNITYCDTKNKMVQISWE